jgi:hypothetical protein
VQVDRDHLVDGPNHRIAALERAAIAAATRRRAAAVALVAARLQDLAVRRPLLVCPLPSLPRCKNDALNVI